MARQGIDFGTLRARMVEEQLRSRGIRSPEVLNAMAEIPRECFLPPDRRSEAYRDRALPLSQGQTISQPFMVAVMTEALGLTDRDRVLEIGTGSGYQTAVLARLAREVYTIERIPRLSETARETLEGIGVSNVIHRAGDGSGGWPEKAPFVGILVTAGAPDIPRPLKDQLDPHGGTLVIPVGDRFLQELIRIRREGTTFSEEKLLSCRFVPLLGSQGWETPDSV